MGVLIDNSIEAVVKSKKRSIGISLYIEDDKLNIKISNTYKGTINIDRLFDEGYTTKGSGHGYGLALAKKIIDSNPILSNSIEISDKIFSQIISVKYRK
jgi:two-component system sensor histidine kinase AgrC